jgi:hypothetical protein
MHHRALAYDNQYHKKMTDVCRALVGYTPLERVIKLGIHVARKTRPQNVMAQSTARQAGYARTGIF